ncbi:hypothetical protein Igag_1257 [Ignisphaera aggregans DSM 17230]|uniref:Uncharacterized protein n=1 Tax=Ignisphaera aggregans (strain DSM 17230 / JCM 13409 / AQ1.S1) TaxID=583356 RepID=E0SPK7_IGNAA|nr:hypothetical protein Igag_1257 [Ignisphaera aggregans DSM 17230]
MEPLNIKNYSVVYSENAEIATANRTATGSVIYRLPIQLTTTTMVILTVAAISLLAVIAVKMRKRRQ